MFQLAKYNNDPLINHSRVMIRMAYQLYAIADQTENALPDVQFPFLLLHGDKDGLVDISGARKMMEFAKSTDKTLEVFKVSIEYNMACKPCRFHVTSLLL